MTNMVIMTCLMMKQTVQDLLAKWPDRSAVFDDARCADQSLKMIAVHRWFQRGSISSKYWAALVAGAERRRLGVSAEALMHAHAANTDLETGRSA